MNLQDSQRDTNDCYDFYEAAIQYRARQRMPTVGVNIDRRSLRYVLDTFNDATTFNLVCMVCAQSKTHTGLQSSRSTDNGYFEKLTDIQYRRGDDLIEMWKNNLEHVDHNFGFRTFMQRYGTD